MGQGPGGWQVGLQGALGADNRPAAGAFAVFGHQFCQHLQLPPGDFSGGVKGFVGGTLTGGIELAGGPAHQFEQGGPAARLLQGGHHHQQRRFSGSGHGAGHQGPGRQARPSQPQPLRPLAAGQQLAGQGCLPQLAHQGGEGHRGRPKEMIFASGSAALGFRAIIPSCGPGTT